MNRSLSLVFALAGVLASSHAFAQATTADPLGINAVDEPTISQQRGSIGDATSSTVPTGQRNVWDNGYLDDLNLDGQSDR